MPHQPFFPKTLLLLSVTCCLVTAARGADDNAPPAAEAVPQQTIIRISPETTRITGPLDDAGFVDYAEAINQMAGNGVTPENNFEVVMRRVFGLDAIPEEYHDEYCRLLGIAKPTGQVGPIETFEKFAAPARQAGILPQGRWVWLREEYDQLGAGPWTAARHPEAVKWLKSIEPQLDALVAGSQRPRQFIPQLSVPGAESWRSIPSGGSIYEEQRSVARLLSRRAMFRLGNGDPVGAWSDMQGIHRVARLIGGGPRLTDWSPASSIESIALAADRIVLESPHLTDAQAGQFLADLKRLPPLPNMAPVLDVGERYEALDLIQQLAREPLSRKQLLQCLELFGQSASPVEAMSGLPVDGRLLFVSAEANETAVTSPKKTELCRSPVVAPIPDTVPVDWNEVLVLFNQLSDRQVAAIAEKDLHQQKQMIESLVNDTGQMRRKPGELSEMKARLLTAPPRVAGRLFGKWLATMLLQSDNLPYLASVERRDLARLEITRLAFAVELYRRDHGRYPPELASLVPKYVEAVPTDPLSDKPLHYHHDIHGFTLYSVGRNERDDGGRDRYSSDSDGQDYDDIVIRVRQPGNPQPED